MISEFVEYVKQAWKNKPNVSSPLNADSLNHMEDGIENNSKKIKETVTAVNELTENLIKYELITITTTSNSNVSPFVSFGNAFFQKGQIVSLKVDTDANTKYAVIYTDKESNLINCAANVNGEYRVTVGYIPSN